VAFGASRRRYRGRVPLTSRRLAAADRSRIDLDGDKVLAAVELKDGRRAVVTRRAFYVLTDGDVRRDAWCEVDRGSLDPEKRALSVRWVSGASDVLLLGEERASVAFTQMFRERVQASVVHAVSVDLGRGTSPLRVALRRDEDGDLFTQVVGDDSVDLGDPVTLARVEAAEAEVREAAGLRR
jgi:hypothetical protein